MPATAVSLSPSLATHGEAMPHSVVPVGFSAKVNATELVIVFDGVAGGPCMRHSICLMCKTLLCSQIKMCSTGHGFGDAQYEAMCLPHVSSDTEIWLVGIAHHAHSNHPVTRAL